MTKFVLNPPAISLVIQALLACLMAFGFKLTVEQVGAIMALTTAVMVFVGWKMPPPGGGSTDAGTTTRIIGGLLVLLCLTGCTSWFHFSDPTLDDMVAKLCGERLDEAMPQISSEATKAGVPVAELVTAFQTACLFRAKRGLGDAGPAGMDAVYGKIAAKRDAVP